MKAAAFNFAAFCVISLVLGGVVGGLALAVESAFPAPQTVPVTASQLLKYRGIDSTTNHRLLGAQIVSTGKSSSKGVLILGTGGTSSSSEQQPALLLSVRLADGSIKQMVVAIGDVLGTRIRPGGSTVTFVVNRPDEELYFIKVGDRLTKPYDGYARHEHHKKSLEELMKEFVRGVRLQMNQQDFNRVFGGTS